MQNKPASELFSPLKKNSSYGTRTKVFVGLALTVLAGVAAFLFSAQALLLEVTPANTKVSIQSWLKLPFGDEVLLLPGEHQLKASAAGYHPLALDFTIAKQTLELPLALKKLPGQLQLAVYEKGSEHLIEGAELLLDGPSGSDSSTAQVQPIPPAGKAIEAIEAGQYTLSVRHPLYDEKIERITIEGMGALQQHKMELQASYATISIKAEDPGATLLIDEKNQHAIPLSIPLSEGEHDFTLQKPGFKSKTQWLNIVRGQDQSLHFGKLLAADALLQLDSQPSGAGVTVNGKFQGQTPLELELAPEQEHTVTLYKAGYQKLSQELRLVKGENKNLQLPLRPELGDIELKLKPANARVTVNGKTVKLSEGLLRLPSRESTLVISAPGYASQQQTILPSKNRRQRLSITLLTVEEHRFAKLRPSIKSAGGQTLKLQLPDHTFTMGASRREQGRRANETQRKIRLDRAFYIGLHEVSNAQFRQFDSKHSSSHSKGASLNGDSYPVVNISWQQAALYCNWLSKKDGLPAFYLQQGNNIIGFNPKAKGYRLASEAEWAWLARWRSGKMQKYAWGEKMQNQSSKANYLGNYADRSAAKQVGVILPNYDDGFEATSPTGSFKADSNGLYDMGGNVAEWIHDFYQIKTGLDQRQEHNPLGPTKGDYHVVRGPSWVSGSMADLRLAFRGYGQDGKRHIGFRIARNAL